LGVQRKEQRQCEHENFLRVQATPEPLDIGFQRDFNEIVSVRNLRPLAAR